MAEIVTMNKRFIGLDNLIESEINVKKSSISIPIV